MEETEEDGYLQAIVREVANPMLRVHFPHQSVPVHCGPVQGLTHFFQRQSPPAYEEVFPCPVTTPPDGPLGHTATLSWAPLQGAGGASYQHLQI